MLNIPWRTKRCQRPWLHSKLSFCGRCLWGGLMGGHENQCKRLKNANFKVSSNEGRILPCQSFSSLWSLEGVVGINIKVSDSQAFAYLISIFSIKKYLKHYLVILDNWKRGKYERAAVHQYPLLLFSFWSADQSPRGRRVLTILLVFTCSKKIKKGERPSYSQE